MFRFISRSPPNLKLSRYLVRSGGTMGLNSSPWVVVAASWVRWREEDREEVRVSRWQNT